ncbi:MAG TPA: WecB/TagA/CpsF family glycosyltransferase [Micavibrio sp.]|nr:WecB/TagA/CpsF family glycosyltransferase [Micavibrio sp.]
MCALLDKIRIVRDEEDLQNILAALFPERLTRPVRVAFVNAHAFNLCWKDPSFLQNSLACDYIFRDGAGMKILFRLLGRDEGLNMNGTDFIPRLLERYKHTDIALMGTASPHLERAADKIAAGGANPILLIDGFQDDQKYTQALAGSSIRLALLAMGMPKQERIAAMLAASPSPRLIVCGGAILDFIAGKVTRAPAVFRRFGLEWLYRLAQEPKRLFGRYVIGNAVFLWRAVRLSRALRQERRRMALTDPSGLKVLHVVRQYAPAIGGLESYVQNMVRHQKALGYRCEVLTLNKVFHGDGKILPEREEIEGVPVRRVKFFGRRRFFIPAVLPFYFGRFDIVHVHNTDVFYDYGALIAILTKTPFFGTTHGGFFHTNDFSPIKKIYFNTITRFSSFFYKTIFAISQNDFDTFRPLNKNIVLQPNAIEPLGDFICAGNDFLYIGRLAEHKNVGRAIEVFSRLKKRHGVPGRFHVIGPEWDVTVESLKSIADREGVGEDVVFHGAASSAHMRDIVQSCGFYISGSTFEGFGMSMLEAMSVGLIPLVQPNKSFEELVGQSGVGLLIDLAEPGTAAAAIAAYLPTVAMVQRAQAQQFSRNFSWKALVDSASAYYAKELR